MKVNTFDLRRESNKLQQGTPSLTLATTDSFCNTENWPTIPLSPWGLWLFLSLQKRLVIQLCTLTVPH